MHKKKKAILNEEILKAIARKAEVQILDKNSSYAAVSGNSLSADCQIITDSDRTVGNGDVVRMTE